MYMTHLSKIYILKNLTKCLDFNRGEEMKINCDGWTKLKPKQFNVLACFALPAEIQDFS